MEIIGVIYRDQNLDIEQYESFLSEISKFNILGKPIYFKGEYLMYRAMIKVKNSLEKSRINNLVNKYKVRIC